MSQRPTSPEVIVDASGGRRCANCGAQLLGDHCYACGQPVKGMVRHFSSIFGDFLDSVFDLDSRTLRTLGPLYLRPGALSREYFAGHRVRYVSPVRLFFFLCIAAIFALQLTVDIGFDIEAGKSKFGDAQTVEEVESLRDLAVAEITRAQAEVADVPGVSAGLDAGLSQVRRQADERIAWLRARDAAAAGGEQPAAIDRGSGAEPQEEAPAKRKANIQFNETPWNAETNPVVISWLPERANAGLNQLVARAAENVERIRERPRLLAEAFMQALPQTLFVLLPVFALLLKIAYLFKRRLYMEHLIVALHSHAFLCASILVLVGLGQLRELAGNIAWVETPLGWIEGLAIIWMPLYLLLMQKRVYAQGWVMTLLKYSVLGVCYLILLGLGAVLNLLFNLVAL